MAEYSVIILIEILMISVFIVNGSKASWIVQYIRL